MAGRLALVVGSGDLVPRAIHAARDAGWELLILSLHPRADLAHEQPFQIKISRPDQVLRAIKGFGATHVCAVGGLHLSDRQRETLAEFAGDERKQAAGDAKLSQLGSVLLKALGIPFIGIHEIVRDLLPEEGQLGAVAPDAELAATARHAFAVARKAGTLDLGQAVVVSGARVVAVEDIAGTDALLARCVQFRQRGLVGDGRARLVLAKTAKPDQPLHVDLPAVGPDTVAAAVEAGIAAIVVEARRTLLIERAALIAAADAAGIAVLALTAADG